MVLEAVFYSLQALLHVEAAISCCCVFNSNSKQNPAEECYS